MSLPKLPSDPIARQIMVAAEDRLRSYPVLTITGPRQSGKTTLARLLRPKARYVTLEDPDTRQFAQQDPRGFLADIGDVAIIDEVQRVPDLLSYLQGIVDSARETGRYLLTGSSQFELIDSVTQSLAGRTGLLTLQPFSLGELKSAGRAPSSVAQLLQQGLFPPIHDRPVAAEIWLQDYISTYVERDVRALLNIKDVVAFQRFVQLCAGRCGQLLNINALADDAGIKLVNGTKLAERTTGQPSGCSNTTMGKQYFQTPDKNAQTIFCRQCTGSIIDWYPQRLSGHGASIARCIVRELGHHGTNKSAMQRRTKTECVFPAR